MKLLLAFVACFLAAIASVLAGPGGVDTGLTARELLAQSDRAVLARWGKSGAFLRIRGVPDPTAARPETATAVAAEREALAELGQLGFRSVVLVDWPAAGWKNGTRVGRNQRVPLDLREAFERAKSFASTYGDVVAGFEFGNEPDVYVTETAETFLAYEKACYLGARAVASHLSASKPAPWSVMAALSLPPGPYFERLVANGLLSYTDAFNYHYYGYADDFTGVYRQYSAAIEELTGAQPGAARSDSAHSKHLPVMLTEFGYSMLSRTESLEAAGRVRQWRWFYDVGRQIRAERIAAPMAFYLPPYSEPTNSEFGLTRANGASATGPIGAAFAPTEFRRGDFSGEISASGMNLIGARIGGGSASPALAWMIDDASRDPYLPHDWTVATDAPAEVVIDLVASDGLEASKSAGGFFANAKSSDGRFTGRGELVLTNLSHAARRGSLAVDTARGLEIAAPDARVSIELGPMERKVIHLRVAIGADQKSGTDLRIAFHEDVLPASVGRFVTRILPRRDLTPRPVVNRFEFEAARARGNRTLLETRPRASEEPAETEANRWLVGERTSVSEPGGRWTISSPGFPAAPNRRATAELPLPDDFVFPDDGVLRFAYRLARAASTDHDRGVYLEVYFRTANGNLFGVFPWVYATGGWAGFAEPKSSFTMAFNGRAALPWRFRENRPVALVVSFRPGAGPASVELKNVRIEKP